MTLVTDFSITLKSRALKSPFRTALRTVTNFEVIQSSVLLSDGRIGVGECVATPAITGDTLDQIVKDLKGVIQDFVVGRSFANYLEFISELAMINATSSAKACADMAIYDLENPLSEIKLSVATDVTIPISEISEIPELVKLRLIEGFKNFKVKLAVEKISLSTDKLLAIGDLIGRTIPLRIDPNQSWTVDHALEFLERTEAEGILIEFLEQPTPAKDKSALAQIKRNTSVPIMADESCFDMADLEELIELNAVDLINLKLLKCGGINAAHQLAKVAKFNGLGVFVGSMMEGDIGVARAAELASTISPLAMHDLDASWWAQESSIQYLSGNLVLG